jgi:hypothetical protein
MFLRNLLRQRYCPKEWALLEEVRSFTGYGRGERYADALALNLYPSRGLELLGFEIKISKGDWKRELARPDKSAPIQRFCDRWYIVAPPGIVDKVELPPTWGLMESDKEGTKLITKVEAPKLDAEPLTRAFVASVLRNATESMEYRLNQETLGNEAYARGKKDAEDILIRRHQATYEELDRRFRAVKAELAALKLGMKDFEEKSGLRINGYDGPKIGEAVGALLGMGMGRRSTADQWLRRSLDQIRYPLEQILRVICQIEEAVAFAGGQHARKESDRSGGDLGAADE